MKNKLYPVFIWDANGRMVSYCDTFEEGVEEFEKVDGYLHNYTMQIAVTGEMLTAYDLHVKIS